MQQTVPENFLFVILLSKQFRKFTPAAYYSGVSNNIFLKRLTFALDALVYLLGRGTIEAKGRNCSIASLFLSRSALSPWYCGAKAGRAHVGRYRAVKSPKIRSSNCSRILLATCGLGCIMQVNLCYQHLGSNL